MQSLYFLNPKFEVSIFCDSTARFVSDLVGNPEDRISHNEAHKQSAHSLDVDCNFTSGCHCYDVKVQMNKMSHITTNLSSGFQTSSDITGLYYPQRMARGLKFWI